jgi:hypothetical protein
VKLASQTKAARNDPISPEKWKEMFDKIMRDVTNNYGTEGSTVNDAEKVDQSTVLPLQASDAFTVAEALISNNIADERVIHCQVKCQT